MFTHRTLLVSSGIIILSGMFLLGQETWPPPACVDNDGDGYGDPASASCTYAGWDCDDSNPDINPGVAEVCGGGIDEDCDGLVDFEDPTCKECNSPEDCNDSNPCTDEDCIGHLCVYSNNTSPCDDDDPCTVSGVCAAGACTGEPLDLEGNVYAHGQGGHGGGSPENAGMDGSAADLF